MTAPAKVIAFSQEMRDILGIVARLAEAKSAVLLQGESGTGKDLLAHWIHYNGPRREAPLIKVHCPSIPEDLLESELFGHEKGAFTDAHRTKVGKIEMATGGTLYFDQIQELSPSLQAKLLRVVEEQSFERLGGTRTITVDVRVISSATGDLRKAVSAGVFREDLYHRLSVVPVTLPPLRNRREDIIPMAELFLGRERDRHTTKASCFDSLTVNALKGYMWPGNARELRSVVECAALYADGDTIFPSALPEHILTQPATLWSGRERRPSLRDVEETYIRYILDQVGGHQTRAAEILGISRKSLWEKRRRYAIP